MENSKVGKVNWFDVLKSLIVTSGTAVGTALIPIVSTGHFPNHEQITLIIGAAAAAGLTYLGKQLGTNSSGELLKKEQGS